MSQKNLYEFLIEKEDELIFWGKKKGIEFIDNSSSLVSSTNSLIKEYIVKYKNKVRFSFEIKCNNNPLKILVIKNKKRIDITESKNTELFVEKCMDFIIKLRNDYHLIRNYFYINPNFRFRDMIYLKIPLGIKINNAKISVNFDGVYTISVNNFDMIYYDKIEEVLDCRDISKLRKNTWNNILLFFRFF